MTTVMVMTQVLMFPHVATAPALRGVAKTQAVAKIQATAKVQLDIKIQVEEGSRRAEVLLVKALHLVGMGMMKKTRKRRNNLKTVTDKKRYVYCYGLLAVALVSADGSLALVSVVMCSVMLQIGNCNCQYQDTNCQLGVGYLV